METPRKQRSRQQLRRVPGSIVVPRTPTHISEQEDFGEDMLQVDSDPTAAPKRLEHVGQAKAGLRSASG
jgi:hypothetical protein